MFLQISDYKNTASKVIKIIENGQERIKVVAENFFLIFNHDKCLNR